MFTAKKNEKSKNAIIDRARSIRNDYDTPGNIAEKLDDFVNQLSQQGKNKSRKASDVDEQLNGVLDDLQAACKDGNITAAESFCDALFTRADLRPATAKKKSKKSIYTTDEILQNMIAKMEGKSKKLLQEENSISDKLRRDPYNSALAARLQSIRAEAKAVQNQTSMLLDQNNRKAIMKGIDAMAETEKFMLADQDASDENFQHALNKFSDIMSRMDDRTNTTAQGANAFFGSSVSDSSAATIPGVQRVNYAEQAGVADGSNAGRVNYAAAAGLSGSGQAVQTGVSDSAAADMESTFAALDKTIEELKLVDKYYSYKIDDAKADFEKNKEILRGLLLKRETASAIDCISLDGDIDKASIDLDIAEKAIENFASARALNSERLKLAQRAKVEKDINAAGQLVVGGQEFIAASPDIAMYVKDATEKRNDDINEAGAINAVADSAQAQTTSVSGGRAYGNSTSRTKDEDKYNDLKARFGI